MKKDSTLLALTLALPLLGHPVVSTAQPGSDEQQMEQQDSSTQSGSDQRQMDPQDMDPHQQQPYPEEDNGGMGDDMGGALDDTTVTNRVRSALSQENSLKFARINVETRSGVVYLTGTVNSEAEAKKAVEVVQGIDGVQSVKHDLKTKR